MGFHEDAIFPSKLADGSQFGLRHNSSAVSNPTGYAQYTPRMDVPYHVADVSTALDSPASAATLLRFFTARQGSVYAFRFPNPLDRSTAPDDRSLTPQPTDQRLGVGDGVTTIFEMKKAIASSGITRWKRIYKPIQGTTRVAIDGVVTTNFDVDTSSGKILFQSAPPPNSVLTYGTTYHHPMRFDPSVESSMMVGYTSFENAQLPAIMLVEDLYPDPTHGEFFYGGSLEIDPLNTDVLLASLRGRVVSLRPQVSGLRVILPDPTFYPAGGPHFYVNNRSDVHPMNILNEAGTVLAVIQPGQTHTCLLVESATAKRWIVAR